LAFKNNCDIEYRFERLPTKLRPWYKYAMDFVKITRSKTPKIIYANKFLKCYMMENEPLATIEINFTEDALLRFNKRPKNDVKVVTQIGSDQMEITLRDRVISNR
jgi:hypothetical protein